MGKESVPFDPWHQWWHTSPHLVSMVAGGVAGLTVDMVLFPLDSIKTRMQASGGLRKSGGFRNVYRGIGAAALGSVPCSAVFFVTYEGTKGFLNSLPATSSGFFSSWMVCAASAAAGELTACSIRVPTELVKQRMQVGQHQRLRDALRHLQQTGFKGVVGYRATAARDVPFSVLQYPMYELVKRYVSPDKPLIPWQAAVIGACTGCVSAFLTTPLDVCKTRTMLQQANGSGSLMSVLLSLHREEGVRGLFRGATTRSLWMGVGGLLFLGSYEQCKHLLTEPTESRPLKGSVERWSSPIHTTTNIPQMGHILPPPDMVTQTKDTSLKVALMAGGAAGLSVDIALHPLDTLKTRLQASAGFYETGGFRNIWKGLSCVAPMAIPSAAVFFAVYESTKAALQSVVPLSAVSHASAAAAAEISAGCVRVPLEIMKQRLQAGQHNTLAEGVRSVLSREGLAGFCVGFVPLATRDVFFSVVQFTLYEELKALYVAAGGDSTSFLGGGMCGASAAAAAAILTTPLDVVKTRVMLNSNPRERVGIMDTLWKIHAESGTRGLFAGGVPRTAFMTMGGFVYLGVYEGAVRVLRGAEEERIVSTA